MYYSAVYFLVYIAIPEQPVSIRELQQIILTDLGVYLSTKIIRKAVSHFLAQKQVLQGHKRVPHARKYVFSYQKINPQKFPKMNATMLKGIAKQFGFDIGDVAPMFENMIGERIRQKEAETGKKVVIVTRLDDNGKMETIVFLEGKDENGTARLTSHEKLNLAQIMMNELEGV